MKGVILAAGVGSRLRPLTNVKPKCLVRVCGKAMLDYQLDSYRQAGIKEVYIVTGYEGQAIQEHCKHIKDLSIHIVESVDYESTNNMYSLYLLREHLKGEAFVLNNADLVMDTDLVSRMLKSPHESLIAVDTSIYNDESMKVSARKDGSLSDISKTIPKNKAYGCSIDFYKFSKESSLTLFGEVERVIEVEKDLKQWTEVALQNLLSSGALKMLPLPIDGLRWVEIDNYDDLEIADSLFSDFDRSFSNIDALFLDLDGTVYLGSRAITGSVNFIKKMQKLGKKVYFLSNNSSKNKVQYRERLESYGVDATEEDIILSTDGLVHYLKENSIGTVYVVGTKALEQRLKAEGLKISSDTPEYVVVGYDTELTYEKLATASNLITKGVDILATHCDVVCPTENGPIPDVGAILEMLRMTTGKEPVKIFGKPTPSMINHILEEEQIPAERTVVIGDRLYTDMKLAQLAGAKSILVLSGETSRDDVEGIKRYPDLCVASLAKLA